tara:strand:- start:78 stop:551 length:474 start_codon:yes stop_codon:yes gene_type:complete
LDSQKLFSSIGINNQNYSTLLKKHPFLDLRSIKDEESRIDLCGTSVKTFGLTRFTHITTTEFDGYKDFEASKDSLPNYNNFYLVRFISPYFQNLHENRKLFSLRVLPFIGHDQYFSTKADVLYYFKNIPGLLNEKSPAFSYKKLMDLGMFTNYLPFL